MNNPATVNQTASQGTSQATRARSMRVRSAGTTNRGNGIHEVTLCRTDLPSPGGVGSLEETFSVPVTAEELEGLRAGQQLTLTLTQEAPGAAG